MTSSGEAAKRRGARLWSMKPNPHGPATVSTAAAHAANGSVVSIHTGPVAGAAVSPMTGAAASPVVGAAASHVAGAGVGPVAGAGDAGPIADGAEAAVTALYEA